MSPCSPQIARSQICVSVGGVDVCVLRGRCVDGYGESYGLGKTVQSEPAEPSFRRCVGPRRNWTVFSQRRTGAKPRDEVRAALPWRTDRLSRCVARTLPRARHPALAERPASCLCGTSPCVALSDSRRAHGACLLSRMSCSQLPCLALIWFGCWSLGTISLNLIRLRECTDAAVELREQIAAARNDLRARGLGDIFDADAK